MNPSSFGAADWAGGVFLDPDVLQVIRAVLLFFPFSSELPESFPVFFEQWALVLFGREAAEVHHLEKFLIMRQNNNIINSLGPKEV